MLCGSARYPVKEPFVELLKGSLSTFLNAMTFPDKTVYPVASRNDTDFRSLMRVYLDAVFCPAIYENENIFLQEGWHYEWDESGQPRRVGVVYGEMTGAFSSVDEVIGTGITRLLFPDTCYGRVSGGDPEHIPELTYEAFLAAHRRFYHPSNALFFLDGELDAADILAELDREYLSKYGRRAQEPGARPAEAAALSRGAAEIRRHARGRKRAARALCPGQHRRGLARRCAEPGPAGAPGLPVRLEQRPAQARRAGKRALPGPQL